MGKAIFTASLEVIRDMLHLPDDVRIVDVLRLDFDRARGRVTFMIEGDEFPEVLEGELPVRADPVYKRGEDGVTTFAGWELVDLDGMWVALSEILTWFPDEDTP